MNEVTTVEAAAGSVAGSGACSFGALLSNPAMLVQFEELAKRMSTSRITVPEHLRGSVGDCYAIIMQAAQWGMNPFAVAQKTHVVSGKLGYEAQLVNAVITSLAPTRDRLHFEWFGDWSKILGRSVTKVSSKGNEYRAPAWKTEDESGLGVRVWATLKGEDEPRVLELLLTQALTRNSTLWADDPRQQLAYLATKRWARLYCPDVILGVYTPDEYEVAVEKDVTPPPAPAGKPSTRAGAVKAKLKGEPKPSPVVNGESERVVDDPDAAIAAAAELRDRLLDAVDREALDSIGHEVAEFLSGGVSRNVFRSSLMAAYAARSKALRQEENGEDDEGGEE